MTWATLDKSFKYSQDFSAFFQIFKSSQMLPKTAKDIKDSQSRLDFFWCFLLSWPSMGGVLMREASVTIAEKVAEIGDESNSPSVTTSTNSVLTVAVPVLLAICVSRGWSSCKSSNLFRKGWFQCRIDGHFCLVYIYVWVFVSVFFCWSSYCLMERDPFFFFLCQSWYQSLYIWNMFPSSEKADLDSHVALVIRYSFHFT